MKTNIPLIFPFTFSQLTNAASILKKLMLRDLHISKNLLVSTAFMMFKSRHVLLLARNVGLSSVFASLPPALQTIG